MTRQERKRRGGAGLPGLEANPRDFCDPTGDASLDCWKRAPRRAPELSGTQPVGVFENMIKVSKIVPTALQGNPENPILRGGQKHGRPLEAMLVE